MENKEPKGPFGGEELDPILFVDSGDTPELRAAALEISNTTSYEADALGPKITRRELLEDEYKNTDDSAKEWVPNLDESSSSEVVNKVLEYVAKILLALIPLSIATFFILFSAGLI